MNLTPHWKNGATTESHTLHCERDWADNQIDTFLCCIGRDNFSLLRTLVAPAKPGDKTYKELVDALTAHLTPKPLVIAERFPFHKRMQKEGQPIKTCAAGRTLQFWKQPIRHPRLVCGVRNEIVQQRLLTMSDLTFRKAVEEAEMRERALKDVV